MRMTESRLRSLIRSVIRENSWRDTLPGGRTWDYRHPEGEAQKIDYKRAEDRAYKQQGHNGMRGPRGESYTTALSEKFYRENDIDLSDAYYITSVYLDSSKKENFCISDFTTVSDDGKIFLKHYFQIDDDHSKVIKRSELEDLIFNPEKLDMDSNEF